MSRSSLRLFQTACPKKAFFGSSIASLLLFIILFCLLLPALCAENATDLSPADALLADETVDIQGGKEYEF